MMGGMSAVEMKWWRVHHEAQVPTCDDVDKARVEDLTGCIPLLLRPLLRFGGKSFCEVEQDLWAHADLAVIRDNVSKFAGTMSEVNSDRNYTRFYLTALAACLMNLSTVEIADEWFDRRYLYCHQDGTGRYTCGIARHTAAAVLRKAQPGMFLSSEWLNAIYNFGDNRCVVGFLVEQACLSAISEIGFHHGGVHIPSITATMFNGNILNAIPRGEDCRIFFVPDVPNFNDIDALYLEISVAKHTAYVVPIQIAVAKKHNDLERSFYSGWSHWKEQFPGYCLTTHFVCINEFDKSWNTVQAEHEETRGGLKEPSPTHGQLYYVTVEGLHQSLGYQLFMIR